MKNIIFVIGLIFGISLTMVAIGYVLSSQIEYVDLIGKTVGISEEDDEDALLVIDDEGNVVFRYSVESWRGQVRERWDDVLQEPVKINGKKVTPDDFSRFTAVSPFPEGIKTLVFSVSTHNMPTDYSLFWTLNIGTREVIFLGEKNRGVVGNITWSPKETHFAYLLNTERAAGDYFTVDNVETREKGFFLSGEEIAEALDVEYEEEFLPEFRNLRWSEDGERILFVTNIPDDESLASWSIDLKGLDIKKEN